MSDSVRPHRRQPTRLPHPWDSPGKNTGVGCHFLLQCIKVKSERKSLSCVRLLVTPWTVAHQAPPPMGFSRQEYWSGVPLPSPVKWASNSYFAGWYSQSRELMCGHVFHFHKEICFPGSQKTVLKIHFLFITFGGDMVLETIG